MNGAHKIGGRASRAGQRVTSHQSCRYALRAFSGSEASGRRDNIGQGNLGNFQRPAIAIQFTPAILQRRQSGGADGHRHHAHPPRPTETVRDDHGQAQARVQLRSRSIGIDWKEQGAISLPRPDIGTIDSSIGHDMTQPVARNQDMRYGAQDGAGFIQNQLHEPSILARNIGEALRLFTGLYVSQGYKPPLCFRHDFLRHDQDVARARFDTALAQSHMKDVSQIIARSDLSNPGQRYDFDHRLNLKLRAGSNLL
jgi:hypothetical protein